MIETVIHFISNKTHHRKKWKKALHTRNLNSEVLQKQAPQHLHIKMHLIDYPGQVCLARPGLYEGCVAFVQPTSHWGLLQPLRSAHVWLWFRERDMIDSPDGALQLFSYSVQCGSRSPCRCLSAVSAHTAARGYRVIRMLLASTRTTKYARGRDFIRGHLHAAVHTDTCAYLTCMYVKADWFIHSWRPTKLLPERWTLQLEVRIKSYPCFSVDVDLLNTQNKWNLWNVTTAINHSEVSPTGTHYDLHCNPELWESQRKRR